MSTRELEYDIIETKADTGEKLLLKYTMLVSYIEYINFSAEVYGIKVECIRGNGRTYEKRVEAITASWSKIIHIFDVFHRCLVFPDELMSALDELLE